MPGRVKFKDPKPGFWARFVRAFWELPRRLKFILTRNAPAAAPVPNSGGARAKFVLRNGSSTHCLGCGLELVASAVTVKCTANPAHVVHRECGVQLVKGKCPLDGNPLAV